MQPFFSGDSRPFVRTRMQIDVLSTEIDLDVVKERKLPVFRTVFD